MPYFPTLRETYTEQQMVDVFQGYNHNLKIGDGEFYDMKNLTSSYYPLLANRGARGLMAQLDKPYALLGKSKLAYIDGSKLYYGGDDISTYINAAGFAISTDGNMLPKQLISMGAYIVIYPDKLYINTENYTDCGSIDASFSTSGEVLYTLCKKDGSEYAQPDIGAISPTGVTNGALWIDTSTSIHTLKQYNEVTGMWVDIPTVYTKIQYKGIGKQFKQHDGVSISGCATTNAALSKQVEQLNGSKIIYACADNYIVVVGLLDQSFTQTAGRVTVERRMPDLDFITEAENRLWGCKYGLVNGETVNEIYCCALGDFKNWNQFLGLATDSYVASVGTDGPWTGAVTHLGYPIFFKENCLHKVYISSKGAHQIMDTACRGVQKGSHHSLAVVNETLFFKSVTDICAYDGSLPVSVSSQFGTERYYDAVAGTLGDKYYVSMRDKDKQWHLFVYDTQKNFWHHEDSTQALQFARCNGELYYINADTKALMCVNATEGDPEKDIEWMAMTGLMGYTTVERKYISRFNLRMKLPKGSKMDIYIQYDSEGIWEHVGHIEGTGTKTFMIPVRPRRCDHFHIKLEGKGEVRIYSFAKVHERGSDCG
jgi:hypothetical protein